MAIRLEEHFHLRAPPGAVWEFLVDPRRVVACVPGGELERIVDDRNFLGRVKIQVGPLTLAYGGQVRLADVDRDARRVTIVGKARETAGSDSARLTLESWLTPSAGGGTDVVANARIDLAGAIVGLGGGFLEQLADLVFQDFVAAVRARLESEELHRVAAAEPGAAAPGPPSASRPIRAIPLVLRALRAWVALKLRRPSTHRPARADRPGSTPLKAEDG